jgi:hypothetical protein
VSGAPAFYAGAAGAALAAELREASAVQGLDGEIAILRAAIRRSLQSGELDIAGVAKAMDLLVRALNARERLRAPAEDDDAEARAAAIFGHNLRFLEE